MKAEIEILHNEVKTEPIGPQKSRCKRIAKPFASLR